MKKYAIAILTALSLSACRAPDAAFVRAVDTNWNLIGPEYRAYVEADTGISAETKVTRKRTAELLTSLIQQAKAGLKP